MDIKILVAAHKKYWMPADDVYMPLHVGAEGKEPLGYTPDNTGDNISAKNSNYCELTGLYWAWKNLECQYIGLCHYRRYFGRRVHTKDIEKKKRAIFHREDYEKLLLFYYRKLSGNIPDVKTVNELVRELDAFGYGKIKLVMDRGFYSKDNINALYRKHYKFIIGVRTMLGYVKNFITEIGTGKDSYEAYDENHDLYAFSKTITWDYEQKRPYKGDVLKDERRMYLHLYYNPEKRLEDEKTLNCKVSKLQHELESGQRKADHESEYGRYFIVKETPKRGIQITVNQEAIDKARERYGFFALVSNEVKDPLLALNIYRTRDVVEKAYFDIKDRLNMRRTLVSSESALEGKIFVEFVALIYLSYIK